MFVIGYGISMDVEDLTFAVLDRDQTTDQPRLRAQSRRLALFRRARADSPTTPSSSGACARASSALAIEIPPGFARDIARGAPVQIGAWIDGAMPSRAETARGYVQGMHAHWLDRAGPAPAPAPRWRTVRIETRFRYNPDVQSLVAMVPAVIPLLLLLIPGDADRARRRAREGAGLDRQSLRHPGHPARSSCSASSSPTSGWPCSISCC